MSRCTLFDEARRTRRRRTPHRAWQWRAACRRRQRHSVRAVPGGVPPATRASSTCNAASGQPEAVSRSEGQGDAPHACRREPSDRSGGAGRAVAGRIEGGHLRKGAARPDVQLQRSRRATPTVAATALAARCRVKGCRGGRGPSFAGPSGPTPTTARTRVAATATHRRASQRHLSSRCAACAVAAPRGSARRLRRHRCSTDRAPFTHVPRETSRTRRTTAPRLQRFQACGAGCARGGVARRRAGRSPCRRRCRRAAGCRGRRGRRGRRA